MSCERARELDWGTFLTARDAPEWADFRRHYPTCEACSAAMARWGELEGVLREQAPGRPCAHLSEDEMLALDDGSLDTVETTRLEAHLSGCAACRTELQVLRTFSLAPSAVRVPDAPREVAAAPSWLERLRDALVESLSPGPVAVFATAVAVALFAIWVGSTGDREPRAPDYAETQAESPAGDEAVAPVPESERGRDLDGSRLAEGRDPAPQGPRSEPEDLQPVEPEALAERPALPDAPSPSVAPGLQPEATPSPVEPTAPEQTTVLLAANFPTEPPRFANDPFFPGDAFAATRRGSLVRSGAAQDVPDLTLLSPESLAVTTEARPRLYWRLDRASPYPIEVVVGDPEAEEPLLERRLAPPVRAGLHVVDLADAVSALPVDRSVEWVVSIVVDASARDLDVAGVAALRRSAAVGPEPGANDPERAHRLADAGRWIDAFDQVQRWREADPENPRLAGYARALLEQVGLDDPATLR